ncbi:uncharacterized protein LOC113288321 isoform X1 [Papaver somniferum]|uniref:uncharacterized protein LOC113288321 isoform X1 n=1 Tax=Papaver somniferum TaxID=3469 RepID=UPI000E6F655E|nr:uncharacterized protein LOC113288321 isoform X1 [Papaver somniferum]XP_026393112.1 uncharacterized protein LOC113288321 isoform X1 [Papaver somniferum]
MEEEIVPTLPLPEAFLNFLNENGLDSSIYSSTTTNTTPRYIRVKPSEGEAHIPELEAEINCKLDKVDWLPNFYSIPPHIQIASTNSYRQGNVYGMDAASGAAVLALNVVPGDHVLDLCAAPGAKLCMLADLLGSSGSLTGVDIAKHRLAACRTMLQKYSLSDHCRLFVADGTSFSLVPLRVSESGNKSLKSTDALLCEDTMDTYKEWTSKRSWKERKRAQKERNGITSQIVLKSHEPELIFYGRQSGVVGLSKREILQAASGNDLSDAGYDKVLVDAECTHDGSIKHIQKFDQWGWKTLQRRVLDAERTDTLANLQLQLLINGFRLLKVGGMLVYSTCSLTVAQNEDIVEQFLSAHPSAELQEIDAANNWPCKSGKIPKTLRFDPLTSNTGGLFVASFTKLGA